MELDDIKTQVQRTRVTKIMKGYRWRRGMWRSHKKCILLITLSFIFLLFFTINLKNKEKQINHEAQKIETDIGYDKDSYKVVHLDLKGSPPKMSYLKDLLPTLANLGCTSLLIEYEDMFPYSGKIVNISARNAYSKKEVRELLTWAHDLGMEVIPLVQTFGHLEHVLKLKEWSHLREVPPYPQSICPSNHDSFDVIQEMISQVMAFHVGARYIHIGADEVFHLGVCPLCIRSNLKPEDLYIKHVKKIAQYVREKYPNVQPIIWDDMMRSWSRDTLEKSLLSEYIEPMIWVYSRNIFETLRTSQWDMYLHLFPKIWVAGAFKGASTPTTMFPDLMSRYENQKSWLNVLSYLRQGDSKIVGYVLTGWSRHDHFSVLCEILPTSLPSLFLNLILINEPKLSDIVLLKKWAESLSCLSTMSTKLERIPDIPDFTWYCSFTSSDLFKLLVHLSIMKNNVDIIEKSMTQEEGWMTSYNIKHNFTSPWRIIEDYTKFKVFPTLNSINMLRKNITLTMNQYFDSYSTNEFLQQKLFPLQNILLNLSKTLDKLIVKKTWSRRPLS